MGSAYRLVSLRREGQGQVVSLAELAGQSLSDFLAPRPRALEACTPRPTSPGRVPTDGSERASEALPPSRSSEASRSCSGEPAEGVPFDLPAGVLPVTREMLLVPRSAADCEAEVPTGEADLDVLPLPISESWHDDDLPRLRGERPARYLNLFWRQQLRQKGEVTAELLARHNAALARAGHPQQAATAGNWLVEFLTRARSIPVEAVSQAILGTDLGPRVACYLDGLSPSEPGHATVADDCWPDGKHVRGFKRVSRPVMIGEGRAGFVDDDDASISTPGCSTPQNHNRQSHHADDNISDPCSWWMAKPEPARLVQSAFLGLI